MELLTVFFILFCIKTFGLVGGIIVGIIGTIIGSATYNIVKTIFFDKSSKEVSSDEEHS